MNFVVERIEQLRTERGWTVYKLSQESGLSETAIHRWIGTKTFPSIPALIQICDAFSITLADFFSKGNLVEITADKKKLHDQWCSLTKAQQQSIESIIANYIANDKKK